MVIQSPEQLIQKVFKRFQEADGNQTKWTNVDTNMECLAYLDDEQLVREADYVLEEHLKNEPRCKIDHTKEECFVPTIVKVVNYLISDYRIGGLLFENDRYILEYYISLSSVGEIFNSV
jgi:hypothetical protein